MNWESDILKNLGWTAHITNREGKQKVAGQVAAKVRDGDVIGVGSGSTSYLALLAIAERVKSEHLHIKAIPTSLELSLACTELGIPVSSLYEQRPDWVFDGADEVDPRRNLIKGRGGAMFREKLLMSSCDRRYILIDESKLVDKLGSRFPVPVEVFPQALFFVEKMLKEAGAVELLLRPAKGKDGPVITENGNLILDARFERIGEALERDIQSITGVVGNGLFIDYKVELLLA